MLRTFLFPAAMKAVCHQQQAARRQQGGQVGSNFFQRARFVKNRAAQQAVAEDQIKWRSSRRSGQVGATENDAGTVSLLEDSGGFRPEPFFALTIMGKAAVCCGPDLQRFDRPPFNLQIFRIKSMLKQQAGQTVTVLPGTAGGIQETQLWNIPPHKPVSDQFPLLWITSETSIKAARQERGKQEHCQRFRSVKSFSSRIAGLALHCWRGVSTAKTSAQLSAL